MYYAEEPHVTRTEKTMRREKEIFEIIVSFHQKKGFTPTIREIKRYSPVSSTSTIYKYLHKLKDKGHITWESKQTRSITILNTGN